MSASSPPSARPLSARRWSALPADAAPARMDACFACLALVAGRFPLRMPGTQRLVLDLRHVLHHVGAAVRSGAGHGDHRRRQPGDVVRRASGRCSAPAVQRQRAGDRVLGGAQVFYAAVRHRAVVRPRRSHAERLVLPLACFDDRLLRAQFRADRARGGAREADLAARGVAVALRRSCR